MDFKLILLLASVGLLVLVAVFALIGFFSGLKKELKCSAIALVLLLIALLVFGNSNNLLNANGEFLKNILTGIPASAHTVWECVLGFARNQVENGAEIFAEGTESYNFLFNVTSAAARGAMLIAGVLVILIVILLVNAIYRIVSSIYGKKHKKEEPQGDGQALPENVVVDQNSEGENKGAVVVTSTNDDGNQKKSKHRGWGAFVAAVRAIIIIFILFMPIGGISSVLNEVTPETEQLIKDTLNGDKKKTTKTDDMVDMAMDFKDAYYASIIGKFVESPQYFFGESLSNKLFDSAFVVKSKNGSYPLRGEVVTFLKAVNALNGSLDTKDLTQEEVNNAVDALKDSKLLVDVLPVAIEFAYYTPIKDNTIFKGKTLGDLLFAANQQAAFLALRQENWKDNLDAILETVKDVYALGVLNSDFNYLTMDPAILTKAADHITDATAVNKLLNILLLTAVNHDVFVEKIGKLDSNPDLSKFNWKQELKDIVNIYDRLQDLGITSLKGLDTNQLITDILNNDDQFDIVSDALAAVTDLQLFKDVALQVLTTYAANQDTIKDSGTDQVQAVKDLANVNWHDDVVKYLEAVKEALNGELIKINDGLKVEADYFHLDPDSLRTVVDTLFETESFEKILPIATKIALGSEAYKKLIGDYEVVINTADIDWKNDFTTLVDIYEEFLEFGIDSTEEFKKGLDLAKDILEADNKKAALEAIVDKLSDLSLFDKVAVPVGNAVLNKYLSEHFNEIADIIDLTQYTKDEIKEDLNNIVKAVEDVYDATGLDFNLKNLTIDDAFGESIKDALDKALSLNILGSNDDITAIVNGLVDHFHVFGEDVDAKFADVDWKNVEKENLKALVDQVVKLQAFDGFDLPNTKFDYEKLLENDAFLDEVITTLEILVDSDAFLQVMPAVIDKYVLPLVENIDDDHVVADILNKLSSEQLVEEVEKLVDVIRAVVKLNILKYSKEGVNAIHFEETGAMHDIINGIMDSKLMEGFEGRVIRLILKASGIFPNLDKMAFYGIIWDNEQEILNNAVDSLAILFEDERFVILDKDNKFNLNTDLYFDETVIAGIENGLRTLFGSWEPDGTEYLGSELISRLLPEIVDKFKNSIPSQFSELIDIMGLLEEEGADLSSDIRHILYIVYQALDINVQSYLTDKDYNFALINDAVNNIIDAIFDMHCVKGKEAALFSWAMNFAIDKLKLTSIDHTTAEDFKDVDWTLEVENLKVVVDDVLDLLVVNHVNTVNGLKEFINKKLYLQDTYITDDNAHRILDLLEDVLELQTVDTLLPIALTYGLNVAKDKGIELTFLGDDITSDMLASDLRTLIQMARIAVDDLHIVTLYNNKFEGDIPTVEPVLEILDLFWTLNLVDGKEGKLVETLVNKFLPNNNFVKKSDFDFTDFNIDTEWPAIRSALANAYRLFEANNLHTLGEVKSFIKNKDYNNANLITDYNLLIVADIVEALAGSDTVNQAFAAAVHHAADMDAVTKYGDFSAIDSYSQAYAKLDMVTLASLMRKAVDANVTQYFEVKDLDPIQWQKLSELVRQIPDLILVHEYFSLLLPNVLTYFATSNVLNYTFDYTYTVDDFAGVNWYDEFNLVADILLDLDDLFTPLNVLSLKDLLQFVKNGDYLYKPIVTDENAEKVLNILDKATESKLIEVGGLFAIKFGQRYAAAKDYDLDFLNDVYTSAMLREDLATIVSMLREAKDFGAIEYYQTNDIKDLDVSYIANIVEKLEDLNILTVNGVNKEWASIILNEVTKRLKIDKKFTADDFADVDFASENALYVDLIHELGNLIEAENIESISDIKTFISSKFYQDYNAYNDNALNSVQNMLALVSKSSLAEVVLPYALDFGVDHFKMFDLTFLKGHLNGEQLAEDLGTLSKAISYARDAYVVDLIFKKETPATLELTPVVNIVKLLEEANILTVDNLNRDWAALVYNYAAKTLKLDLSFTASDFNDVVFSEENELLVTALQQINTVLPQLGIEKVADAKAFVNNKDYMKQSTYNNFVINAIDSIVDQVVASKLVEIILPALYDYGVDYVSKKFVDVSYLKGQLDGSEIANDIRVLADDVIYLFRDVKALDIYNNKTLPQELPQYIKTVVNSFESINTLKVNQAKLAAILTNYVAKNFLKFTGTVEEEDFANVTDWAAENAYVQAVLDELQGVFDGFFVEQEIKTFDDLKNLPNKFKADKAIITDDLLYTVSRILKAASNSIFVADEVVFGERYLISYLDNKGYDLSNALVTGEEMQADLSTLGDFLRYAVSVNAFGFALREEVLDQNYITEFAHAVKDLLVLNVLKESQVKEQLISYLLSRLGVEVNPDEIIVDWTNESELIEKLIYDLNNLSLELNRLTLPSLKELTKTDVLKSYLNYSVHTDNQLNLLSEVLNDAAESDLVESLIFPLSRKYLTAERLENLADLHNIYANADQFQDDLRSVAEAVQALADIDLYNVFVTKDKDIPYDRLDVVDKVINNIFSLNYFNLPGRIDGLLDRISVMTGIDLLDIDGSRIHMAADGALLFASYVEMTKFFFDDNWFIKNAEQLKAIKINLKDWSGADYRNALSNAVHDIVDTTLVKETNGLIIVALLLPLVKNKFADIYEALEIETYTSSEAKEDFDNLVDVFDDFMAYDLDGLLNGEIFNIQFRDLATNTLNTIRNLNILADHGNALAEAIFDRLDGKTVLGSEIDSSLFDTASVNFYNDSAILIHMFETAVNALMDDGLSTTADAKEYFKTLNKEKLNTVNMNALKSLLDDALLLDLVKYNALAIYDTFLYDRLVKNHDDLAELLDLNSIYASNINLYNDLVLVRDTVYDLDDLGIVSVVKDNAPIPYVSSVLINKVFDEVAQIQYLNLMTAQLVDYLDPKVSKVDLHELGLHELLWNHDVLVLKDIYNVLIPALTDYRNPVQTVEDIKNIGKLEIQSGFIYDYQSIYADAVELVAQISIAPQIVRFAANKLSSSQSGRVKDIVDILDISAMTDADILEDIVTLAAVIRDQIPVEVIGRIIKRTDVNLTGDKDSVIELLTDVFELHMVDSHMEELVRYVVENILNVDLTGVDLSTVDYEAEQAQILVVVRNALDVLESVGVVTLPEANTYYKDLVQRIKDNVKAGTDLIKDKKYKDGASKVLHAVLDELKASDAGKVVDTLVEAFDLELLVKLGLPVYEQKVYNRFTGIMTTVGDIHDYTEDQFRADLGLLQVALPNLYNSGIYKAFTEHSVEKTNENVTLVQDAVRALANLDILDIKRQDLGVIADYLVQRIGLANLVNNYSSSRLVNMKGESISFKADAESYADMVPYLYDTLIGYANKGVTGAFFGETDAIRGLVEMYAIAIDTTVGEAILPRVINLVRNVAKRANITLNADSKAVLYDIANILNGLCDMGIFSNDGFDFTNSSAIENMRDSLFDMATLPDILRKAVNSFVARAYHLGVIPFTWEDIELRTEFNLIKDNAKKLLDIVKPHLDEIKNKNISFLNDASVQFDILAIAREVKNSSFATQLVIPFMEGVFKAFTSGHYDGVMEHNATLDDLVNEVLPDIFEILDNLYNVNGLNFNNKLSMYAFASYANIVDIIFSDIILKDNIDAFLATLMGKYGEYELSDTEKADLAAIDYSAEKAYYVGALRSLANDYALTPFEIGMDNLSSETLYALANAVEWVAPSQIIAKLGTGFFTLLAKKVVARTNKDFADEILYRIETGTYTNDKIVHDVDLIPTFFRSVADARLYEDVSTYENWNFDATRSAIHCIFNLYLLETRQTEIIDTIFEKIPFIKENYDPEEMVISDWEVELIQIVNTLEEVINAGFSDFNTPIDDLGGKGEIFVAAQQSVILRSAFLKRINENLVANGLSDYAVTAEDMAHVQTKAEWDAEIAALQEAEDLMEGLNDGTIDPSTNPADAIYVRDVYRDVRDTSYIGNKVLRAALENAGIDPSTLD